MKLPVELPSVEEQLKQLVAAKTPIDVIAASLNRQPDAILMKCKRIKLKLEVVVAKPYTPATTTTSLVVPKELPSVDEEKQLREMVQEHKRLSEIAGFFGISSASVKMKINRLKLVVVVRQIQHTTTSNELPSVEETLKDLVEGCLV